MDHQLARIVKSPPLTADEIGRRTRHIHRTALARSSYLDTANFTVFHPSDLRLLYSLYDREFFEGNCSLALGGQHLRFQISRRMTSAAGKTTRHRRPSRTTGNLQHEYSISVSSPLLFQNLEAPSRPARIGGLLCHDRLEALQRVFEHELVHLVEMLLWSDSSCSQSRFRNIARGLFGHTEHVHRLITPRERAFRELGIKIGDVVTFESDGKRMQGFVNRITKRATILVADPHGQLYSDGRHYSKYYVPLHQIRPLRKPQTT